MTGRMGEVFSLIVGPLKLILLASLRRGFFCYNRNMTKLTHENWTHYLYIIQFVDGCYYTGVSKRKGDNPLCDNYWGSPSNREKWNEVMFEKQIIAYLWCNSHAEAYQMESQWQKLSYCVKDVYCLNKVFSPSDWTFEGRKHCQSSKDKTRKTLQNLFEKDGHYREQLVNHAKEKLGKSKHKRNPSVGTEVMSGPNKRQYMRRHWRKEVWDDVKEKWENRTGYHWGKTGLARKHGESVKTIENMLELIIADIDWRSATHWEGVS